MGYNAEQVGINANYLICCSTDFLDWASRGLPQFLQENHSMYL
jgi:hypothetical protein